MKKYLVLLAFILIQSCSTGDGDSTIPTSPTTSFSLLPSNYFTNYTKTINLTGSDSNGAKYTASWSERTGTQTTFLGESAIPIYTQIQVKNTSTGAFVTIGAVQYYSTSASDRRYLGDTSDTTTVSATTTPIPQSAVIGAFGVIGTYTDNAGDVESQSWRLEDGGNGRAKMKILYNNKDQFGNALTSEIQTFLIDENGNRLSFTEELYVVSSGITLTLSGS